MAELCDHLTVFEEAYEKVARAAAAKKSSGYSSEDGTRPNKSPDSELRSVVNAVQRGLRKARAMEPKKKDDLENKVCALLTKDGDAVGDAGHYTPTQPRRSPQRAPPKSAGSMETSGPSGSMVTGSSGRKSASKALSVSFGDDHAMDNMRERIAARRKQTKQAADKAEKSMKKARAREGRPRKTQRKRLPTKTAGNLRNV